MQDYPINIIPSIWPTLSTPFCEQYWRFQDTLHVKKAAARNLNKGGADSDWLIAGKGGATRRCTAKYLYDPHDTKSSNDAFMQIKFLKRLESFIYNCFHFDKLSLGNFYTRMAGSFLHFIHQTFIYKMFSIRYYSN